jgi:hypothetical protein
VGHLAISAGRKIEEASMPNTPAPETTIDTGSPEPVRQPTGKHAIIAKLLRRRGGATIDDLKVATGWPPHSIRGATSGALKRKYGLPVTSVPEGKRGRVYRIAKGIDA